MRANWALSIFHEAIHYSVTSEPVFRKGRILIISLAHFSHISAIMPRLPLGHEEQKIFSRIKRKNFLMKEVPCSKGVTTEAMLHCLHSNTMRNGVAATGLDCPKNTNLSRRILTSDSKLAEMVFSMDLTSYTQLVFIIPLIKWSSAHAQIIFLKAKAGSFAQSSCLLEKVYCTVNAENWAIYSFIKLKVNACLPASSGTSAARMSAQIYQAFKSRL